MAPRSLGVFGIACGLVLIVQFSSRLASGDEPQAKARGITHAVVSETVTGNNRFASDLYGRLKEKTSGNLFVSPYSISTALAMTYAGSAGETQRQMAEVLHFAGPEPDLHQNMARLRESLLAEQEEGLRTARGEPAVGSEGMRVPG